MVKASSTNWEKHFGTRAQQRLKLRIKNNNFLKMIEKTSAWQNILSRNLRGGNLNVQVNAQAVLPNTQVEIQGETLTQEDGAWLWNRMGVRLNP